MKWIGIIIPTAIILILSLRVILRGYFWKAKDGTKLNFRQFLSRWGKGIEGITPIQQTKTSLIGFMPIITGTILGLVITFLSKAYWVTLILYGSLPIVSIQLINLFQKYKIQKRIEQSMKEAEQIVYEEANIVQEKIEYTQETNNMLERIKKGEFKQ